MFSFFSHIFVVPPTFIYCLFLLIGFDFIFYTVSEIVENHRVHSLEIEIVSQLQAVDCSPYMIIFCCFTSNLVAEYINMDGGQLSI